MKRLGRRNFLKLGVGAAAALSPLSRVLGANDDLRVAVVGFRSQGRVHIRYLRELPGVRVVALCDPDRDVLDRGLRDSRDAGEKPRVYTDIRKLLEDRNIDAITTATPDHWHALVAIWACQAGKDAYVEKPLCHSIREGRKMVEAARKYNRIVAFGNQSHGQRTGEMQLEKKGLGKILVAHASLSRGRQSIGKVKGPQKVPESLDYNLWTGPAPMGPLMRKRLHYDWHWVWPTGTGEIGNNGIYPLDACRLSLGQKALPRRVLSFGGRFLFNDDGTTPNTQVALFEYDPGPLVIFEVRNLPKKDGPGLAGSRIKCERGSSGPPGLTGKNGDTGGYSAHKGHLFNFLSAVRSRKASDLRADVLEGHLSTALVHMANISYRLGAPASVEEIQEAMKHQDGEAMETFQRFRAHLSANGVDLAKTPAVLGPWLEMDREKEEFTGNSPLTSRANQLVRGHSRKPFVIPDEV